MCPCHLLSEVMPDQVLGISCFRFYLLIIELNTQQNTCVQSHQYSLYSLYSMYCLYFFTVQTFICVQINLFSQLCFLSSPTSMPSSEQLYSLQKRKEKEEKEKLTFVYFASSTALLLQLIKTPYNNI